VNLTGVSYEPERAGPLFHASQIQVPPMLESVVKEFTKAAIREQPAADELYEWALRFFEAKAAQGKSKA